MAIPKLSDLRTWDGTQFTNDDWDYNAQVMTNWVSDGNSDLVVNSVKADNGFDAQGAKIINVAPATTGTDAVNYDQVQSLLGTNTIFSPYSVASGKVDSNGNSSYIQKDSDTQITLLAGNTNPDLVVVQSDGTIETLTDNVVLTISVSDGTYYAIKEKGETPIITSGTITEGIDFPTTPNDGDYFLDYSVIPFKGYKYASVGGWSEQPFVKIGKTIVSSGTATSTANRYNQNGYHINTQSYYPFPDPTKGVSKSVNTSYTADVNGWVFLKCLTTGRTNTLTIDGVVMFNINLANADNYISGLIPIAKGSTYIASSDVAELIFYPAKGV